MSAALSHDSSPAEAAKAANPTRVELYDTTLRDGSQGEGVNFSLADKLAITRRLDELGFDFIEGGYPLSNEKDEAYFREAAKLDLRHAQVCAFGMTRRRGVDAKDDIGMQALVASQAPVCTIVGKTWDLHVEEVLRVSLDENCEMIRDSLAFVVGEGRRGFYDAEHFFDGYEANPDYAMRTLKAAVDGGAELLILCDTNGGSLPERVAEIVRDVRDRIDARLGIHCHNDSDLATANSLAALSAGCDHVQGTINGIGERCGNADLINVAANLAFKKGHTLLCDGGLERLTELSRFVYELANMNFQNNQPFVGPSAFAHKGGMHVHAVNRIAHSYEHIDPATIGNQRRILVSELSGRSNIVAKTTSHRIAEDDELMQKILLRVQELEAIGYQFEAAEASFDLLVQRTAGTYVPHFERERYRVSTEGLPRHEDDGQDDPLTEATIKLQLPNEDGSVRQAHVVGEGDGPVNALDNALRKAVVETYPSIESMRLRDYKVRVINSTEGTAARVRVVIDSSDEHDTWSTVGVSENIIEASWLALRDAVEYKLAKDAGAFATDT